MQAIVGRLYRAALMVALFGIATSLVAQEQLPKAMSGNWTGTFIGKGGNPVDAGGTWSVVVDKQNADGSIEGKMTFSGRFCAMDNAPMTGKYDGNELTMKATFKDQMPNGGCREAGFILKKIAGNRFEGTIPSTSAKYRLTLGPS